MPPHVDYSYLKRNTRLRPDKYNFWFRFKDIYPQSYVTANGLEDRGQSYLLLDGAFYHGDKTKSVFHQFLIAKDVVEQLSSPPDLGGEG